MMFSLLSPSLLDQPPGIALARGRPDSAIDVTNFPELVALAAAKPAPAPRQFPAAPGKQLPVAPSDTPALDQSTPAIAIAVAADTPENIAPDGISSRKSSLLASTRPAISSPAPSSAHDLPMFDAATPFEPADDDAMVTAPDVEAEPVAIVAPAPIDVHIPAETTATRTAPEPVDPAATPDLLRQEESSPGVLPPATATPAPLDQAPAATARTVAAIAAMPSGVAKPLAPPAYEAPPLTPDSASPPRQFAPDILRRGPAPSTPPQFPVAPNSPVDAETTSPAPVHAQPLAAAPAAAPSVAQKMLADGSAIMPSTAPSPASTTAPNPALPATRTDPPPPEPRRTGNDAADVVARHISSSLAPAAAATPPGTAQSLRSRPNTAFITAHAETTPALALAPVTMPGVASIDSVTAPAPTPALDVRDARWVETMIDRIENLRDGSGVRETRMRLSPDALGAVEVRISETPDGVRVHLTADTAAARQLLAEAAPRLADMAEARGLKLAQDGAQQSSQQQQQSQANPHDRGQPQRNRAATRSPIDPNDERIA